MTARVQHLLETLDQSVGDLRDPASPEEALGMAVALAERVAVIVLGETEHTSQLAASYVDLLLTIRDERTSDPSGGEVTLAP